GLVSVFLDANSFVTRLQNGSVTLPLSTLSGGMHSIFAIYDGDANFSRSTSATLTQTVNQADTTTTVTSSPNPSRFGQTFSMSVTVMPVLTGIGTPTGDVEINIATSQGNLAFFETLQNGSVSFNAPLFPPPGTSTITAEYFGDGNFNESTSATIT